MIKNKTNLENVNTKSFVSELAFVVCLCMVAVRATFTEGINVQSSSTTPHLSSIIVSLSFSFVLVLLFAFWLCRLILLAKARYRFSGIEWPLVLFVISAGVGIWFASNRRLAINHATILIAPIMMAVVLTQIVDRSAKVKLLLIVIAALGFLSTVQCFEQFFSGNDMAIQQYEQDPESMLRPLGITKGTFQQFLFEHRIYSKGIKGFFMTSNSAGSFSILASFAAFALFYNSLKRFKAGLITRDPFMAAGVGLAIVVAGLVVTKSKGAIGAAFVGAFMLAIYLKFPKIVKANPKKIAASALLVLLLAVSGVVYYGQTHGSLPGGNSMLVRWQYWKSTAEMVVDHWLVGVGPGNFAHYYTQYKIPAALETVADPHNFIMSLLSQFGVFGVLAFLAMIFVPVIKALSKSTAELIKKPDQKKIVKAPQVIYLVAVSVVLLIIRPMLMKIDTTSQDVVVVIYVAIVLYVMPVLVFAMGFFMFGCSQRDDAIETDSVTKAAIFCGVIAVLIHNLIDFAIFEPSVYTAVWVMVAALVAVSLNSKTQKRAPKKLRLYVKLPLVVVIVMLSLASVVFGFYWPTKADGLVKKALGRGYEGAGLLEKASQADPLNTAASSMSGKLFMYEYSMNPVRNLGSLGKAADSFVEAVRRDPEDYKNYEKLVDVYSLLAQRTEGVACEENLRVAFGYAEKAVELYPGSARIRFKYAQVADQLKMTTLAISQYLKAVEIEDAFVVQFKTMYPGRDVVSRLGTDIYNQAKDRSRQLMR